jgi:hypothetical protein
MYFSKTKGFVDEAIFGALPEDAISLTDERYAELMDGQFKGKNIKPDAEGIPQLAERPALTSDQIFKMYEGSAEQLMKDVAQEWGYSSIIDAASYVNSTNKQYKAEAEALIQWRDLIWAKIEALKAKKPAASAEKFISQLPTVPEKPIA